ncbi:branched-chain amino acid transport system substrate-binding protein [Pseudoduganella flava]|uniref:ABC transporter substrate-binding protein n=1 Tax=Pseudoduganella flava TaxID=871742 RepID=A0A562PI43_9BURK|nr:ABC transporter substrate-binding protein [Pseudoduganella flava]QGZ37591.1 ABC transporter substrate-binding protein [Pseudoduganella flava]TWI44048.1 branched-chain amino acid transport system substrate-binding protein [Pseudoduganella flava]
MRIRTIAAVVAIACLPLAAQAQDTIKIGVIAALTGPFANTGKPFEDGIRTWLQQNGSTVAGKKIEVIYRDDGGTNADLSKRAAQELIAREKVSFLIGFSLTPSALAVAPIATQGKTPMIVMNAVTTGITAKSPYMVRTSMTMHQMTEPFGTWTGKSKIGKVYTLVSDYSTGIDAESKFIKGFNEAGGKVIGSARVPLANPDYSPFVQRIKDEKPDALFFFAPGAEDGTGLLKAFTDKGLDKAGIKFLGVGDMTSDTPTLEALGERALGAVTVLNYSTALDNDANKAFLKAYAAANPNRPPATFVTVAAYDTMGMIYETIRKLNGNVTGPKAIAALAGMKWNSPRGPITIDATTRDIVQNMYIREVKKVGGKLVNEPIGVLKDVPPQ